MGEVVYGVDFRKRLSREEREADLVRSACEIMGLVDTAPRESLTVSSDFYPAPDSDPA
jgi:hypothetical protein